MVTKPMALVALCAAGALAACGASSTPMRKPASGARSSTSAPASRGMPAQQAPSERQSAATGDIPDNQVFLTFGDRALGVELRYPEGWTEHRRARQVTFVDNANAITLTLSRGGAPTPAQVRDQLLAERSAAPGLAVGSVGSVSLPAGQAIKARYTVRSRPDPVTAKRVTLLVDRYAYSRGGRVAVLDLATPQGVDNVDAYRMISRSFRWL